MGLKNPWPRVKNWYWRNERRVSSLALLGGFIFDAVALKRVDLFLENFWIVVHLLMAGGGILLLNLTERRRPRESVPGRLHFWLIILIQFAFGGLFSTFLVFYFRSATLATSWPFLLLLTVNLIANEALKHRYTRLTFQINVFFLSLFSFAIFLLPVLLHRLGATVFILSGLVSLLALFLFLWLVRLVTREQFQENRRALYWSVGGLFVVMNILYFSNIIPPIPLALKDGDVYHQITRLTAGNYLASDETKPWWDFFNFSEPLHVTPGETLYAYSAIFSPAFLDTNIVHEWQHYDAAKGGWITTARISLPIVGGRDGGYRTYSTSGNLAAGDWRVNVATTRGQLLGRLKFTVIPVLTPPPLVSETLN